MLHGKSEFSLIQGGGRSATPVNGKNCLVSTDSCQVLRIIQKGETCKHSIMKPDCASIGDHVSSKMFIAEINNTSQIVRNASVSAGDLQNRIQGQHIAAH